MLLIERGASAEVLPFRTRPIYVHTFFSGTITCFTLAHYLRNSTVDFDCVRTPAALRAIVAERRLIARAQPRRLTNLALQTWSRCACNMHIVTRVEVRMGPEAHFRPGHAVHVACTP